MKKKFYFLKHLVFGVMVLFGGIQEGLEAQPTGFETKTGMNCVGEAADFAALRATFEVNDMPGVTQYKTVVLYKLNIAQPERLATADLILSATHHVKTKSFLNTQHALPALIDSLPKKSRLKLKAQYGVKLTNQQSQVNQGVLKGCWTIGKNYRYLIVVGMMILDHTHANDSPPQIQELLRVAHVHKQRKCPGCQACNGLGFGIWAVGKDSSKLYHRMFHKLRV